MSEIEVKNAKIVDTFLGYEDHGFFTFRISLKYGEKVSQSFGHFRLGNGAIIEEILNVLEVESWEKLIGTPVRVKCEWEKIHSIGNFLEDRWINPKEFFEKRKKEEENEK